MASSESSKRKKVGRPTLVEAAGKAAGQLKLSFQHAKPRCIPMETSEPTTDDDLPRKMETAEQHDLCADDENDDDYDICDEEAIVLEQDIELDEITRETLMKSKNHKYSYEERRSVLQYLQERVDLGESQATALRDIRETWPGFEKLTHSLLRHWRTQRVSKPLGRPVNIEFERAILDKLIASAVALESGEVTVVGSVAYNRFNIVRAANLALKDPRFAGDEKLKSLKFSIGWVTRFLSRHSMHRRRVTSVHVAFPPEADVKERLAFIQQFMREHGLTAADIINADETGIFFGAQPRYLYVAAAVKRAAGAESDEKSRFTALLWGSADGTMGPAFYIISCSVAGAPVDYTGSRVLNNLLKDRDFNPPVVSMGKTSYAWELRVWDRKMTLETKKRGGVTTTTAIYKRPYLINVQTQDVITVQTKAWSDTVGIAMWVDVQLGPAAKKRARPYYLIWDNCGPHNVPALKEVFEQNNIYTSNLPPKCTSILQVMDLVVNGPVKSAIRLHRSNQLFDYLQTWKLAVQANALLPVAQQQVVPYNPPKPKQSAGLLVVIKAVQELSGNPDFQANLRRTFVTVCQAPLPPTDPAYTGPYTFCPYPGHEAMQQLSRKTMKPAVDTIIDILSQLQLTERDADTDDEAEMEL